MKQSPLLINTPLPSATHANAVRSPPYIPVGESAGIVPAQLAEFTEIYDLYQHAIYHYCLRKCRDPELGKDLTQETFLRFFLCLQRDEKILLSRAFLYRIAHNLIIDYVRKKKEASLDQLVENGFEPSIDHWEQSYSRLDSDKPIKMLMNLQRPYRKVLHQRFILGLPPAEIAKLSGEESSNAISVRIFRGLKALRRQIAQDRKLPVMEISTM